jgi:hypothetical protein
MFAAYGQDHEGCALRHVASTYVAFPTARPSLAAFLICGATDAGSTGCCSNTAAVISWVLSACAENHTGLSLDMS